MDMRYNARLEENHDRKENKNRTYIVYISKFRFGDNVSNRSTEQHNKSSPISSASYQLLKKVREVMGSEE